MGASYSQIQQTNESSRQPHLSGGDLNKFLIFTPMNKLFIGGFPIEMTELELVQLIAPYADVVTIKLVRDRATKKCKGYGFIEVADKQHAINAIDGLNNTVIGDRVLSLNMVPEQPAAKSQPFYSKEKGVQPSDRIKRPRRPRF